VWSVSVCCIEHDEVFGAAADSVHEGDVTEVRVLPFLRVFGLMFREEQLSSYLMLLVKPVQGDIPVYWLKVPLEGGVLLWQRRFRC